MITSVHRGDDIRIFQKESKTLSQNGYAVTIFCPDFQGVRDNIRFIKMMIYENRILRILTSWKIAYNYVKDFDGNIFHIHDPELVLTAYLLKCNGKKVIYDVHEDIEKQILSKNWIPKFLRKTISKIVSKFIIKICNKLDFTVCATEKIAEKFNNSITFYNFPDKKEYEMINNIIPYEKREKIIVYVGAISENRGIYNMINAIIKTDYTLYLAGKCENEHIKSQVLGNKKVEYLGEKTREETIKLLLKSKIGIILLNPTEAYKESIPIKIMEYMLAELPIIASNFKFWKDFFGEDNCIYVNPQNDEEAAEKIAFLESNPQIAFNMGQKAKQYAEENFDIDTEKQKLLNIYKKLGEK